MNPYLLNGVQTLVCLSHKNYSKIYLFLLFLSPFLLQAQCTNNPGIISSAGNVVYFDIDSDGANDFALSRNSAFSIARLYVLGNEASVYLGVGTEIVNVLNNTSFDGLESSYSSGGFQEYDLDESVNNWLIMFKYQVTPGGVPTGVEKLGFLRISIIGTDMTLDEYGIQSPSDNDGVLAGDCASLTNSALPIELSYFKLHSNEEAIQLSWETLSEKSNAGFEIQRSLNAHNFQTIAWLEGAGDSYSNLQYQFEDNTIRKNISYYYRLKNVNYDGSFELSAILIGKLVSGKKDPISPFFPNPVMEQATKLQFVVDQDQKVQISLYNAMGKQVKYLEKLIEKGGNVVELETSDLLSGNYFALIQMGDDVYQQKLVVSK